MKFNNLSIGVVLILLYLLNLYLFYLNNTETIGLIMLFFNTLFTNTILYGLLFTDPMLPQPVIYTLYGISGLLFISTFLMFLGVVNLHRAYSSRSEPIKHFPERRRALTNYEYIYGLLTGLVFLLSAALLYKPALLPAVPDGWVLPITVATCSVIGIGDWLCQIYWAKRETDLILFLIGTGVSLVPFICGYLLGAFTDKLQALYVAALTLMLEGSAYSVFLSHWVYRTSQHVLL
jgi:hypothetical protein